MLLRPWRVSLAWKMVTQSTLEQFREMSSVSKLVTDRIIFRKWRLVTYVEAKFRLVRCLKILLGKTQYNFPLPDRSSSFHFLSIIVNRLIEDHHSKQVPAALAKSFRFRSSKTKIQITEEVFILTWMTFSVKREASLSVSKFSHLSDMVIFLSARSLYKRWMFHCFISLCVKIAAGKHEKNAYRVSKRLPIVRSS